MLAYLLYVLLGPRAAFAELSVELLMCLVLLAGGGGGRSAGCWPTGYRAAGRVRRPQTPRARLSAAPT